MSVESLVLDIFIWLISPIRNPSIHSPCLSSTSHTSVNTLTMQFLSASALLLLALALPEQALASAPNCSNNVPLCAGGVKTNPPNYNPTCGCPDLAPPCDEYLCGETGRRVSSTFPLCRTLAGEMARFIKQGAEQERLLTAPAV